MKGLDELEAFFYESILRIRISVAKLKFPLWERAEAVTTEGVIVIAFRMSVSKLAS
jgi:hypothetical protein